MLTDSEFVQETIVSGSYYLRTLREFCEEIQVSFLPGDSEYIKIAEGFALRCEELGRILVSNADGNVPQEVLDSDFLVTDYTLQLELLTEKLFNVDIDTSITEKEQNIKPGNAVNPSQETINELMQVNIRAKQLVSDFLVFLNDIISKMHNNELFAYVYISSVEIMKIELNVFDLNLDRLINRGGTNPTFVIDYEYLFNTILLGISGFIRGLVDPVNSSIFNRANSFVSEYDNLTEEYRNLIMSPESQRLMSAKSLSLAARLRVFLENCIEELLAKRAYFLISPMFFDNGLTAVNYFTYVLTNNQKIAAKDQV